MPASVPYAGQVSLPIDQRFGARPHALLYGAVPDGRVVYDGAITSGTATFTSATADFEAKHVGRMIYVLGAGASGAILITTISAYTNATTVTLATSASTTVSGKEAGFGTDNATAFANARTAQDALGNAMFLDGGCYLTSQPLELAAVRWYGPCPHIDIPASVDLTGRHACIVSTANPAVKIAPYPGTALENVHIHCPGTTQTIDLWEQENYPYQVGLHLGNTGAPLTITGDAENYGVGGNGAVFVNGVAVSGASGWAVYAYKLWGQSLLKAVQIFNCGTVPSGGDPTMHGGIYEASECADISYDLVHIIGIAAGYSGPKQMGCGIKRGGNGTTLDALDRFKIGPTHSKFSRVMVEGKGKYSLWESTAFASTYSQCFFGGAWEQIRIGEAPLISWLNHETVFHGCGSFALPDMYIRSKKVQICGWMAEGTTLLKVHYNYPGLTITGRNISLRPEKDDGALSGYPNRAWESLPIAKTDTAAAPYSLVPDFSSAAWTFTITPPASSILNHNLMRLAQGGYARCALTGLTAGAVYTCAFRHRVAFDAALDGSTFRVFETAGADIIALQVGSSDTATAGTVTWVLFQFVAPTSGNVTFECKNTDFNQTEWIPPFIGFGALTEVCTGGYLIQADFAAGTVTGSMVRHTAPAQVWGDILARKSDTMGAALLGRAPAQRLGVGMNARYDGTNWRREGDGSYNGGGLVLCRTNDGAIQFAPLPSTGTDPDTVTASAAEAAVRLVAKDGGAEVLGAAAAVESALSIKKVGASAPANVEYRLAHMANGKDFILYAFDGTTAWNVVEAYHTAGQVLVNGVDVANLFPSGTAGRFLRSNGGTSKAWEKVDVGDAANVKFTGATSGRPVKAAAGGELVTGIIDLTDAAQISLGGLAGGWFLIVDGTRVNALSPAGAAAAILSAAGVIGIISGLAGFDLTTLDATFTAISAALDALNDRCDDLQTQVDGKAATGHGHSGTTSSGGTPSHTHGWST
jgi:hypothetical protein